MGHCVIVVVVGTEMGHCVIVLGREVRHCVIVVLVDI